MAIQSIQNQAPISMADLRGQQPAPVQTARPAEAQSSEAQSAQQSATPPNPLSQGANAKMAEESQKAVVEAANKANQAISAMKSNLQFTVDDNTGINIVKVVDTETKQTIRQIPSEEMITIAQRLDELKGLLVKNTA